MGKSPYYLEFLFEITKIPSEVCQMTSHMRPSTTFCSSQGVCHGNLQTRGAFLVSVGVFEVISIVSSKIPASSTFQSNCEGKGNTINEVTTKSAHIVFENWVRPIISYTMIAGRQFEEEVYGTNASGRLDPAISLQLYMCRLVVSEGIDSLSNASNWSPWPFHALDSDNGRSETWVTLSQGPYNALVKVFCFA